jgi:hypothetical protein
MVFWLAVLIGALGAWTAVRIGFYATWILFFHILLATYVAVLAAPLVVESVPAATAIPGYGYALTLLSIAVAMLFIGYGTCYACLSGQMLIEFPRFFDTIAAGFVGFLAGFQAWSFLAFAFCLTPLAEFELAKRLGFDAPSQRTNTGYVCWWCDRFHSMVRPLGCEVTSEQSVGELLKKAAPAEAKPAKSGAPASPSAAQTPAAPGAAKPAPPPPVGQGKKDAASKPSVAPSSLPSPPPSLVSPPSPPAAPAVPPSGGESLDEEIGRRRLVIYTPDAVQAAVTNPEIRIIEVADICGADRFEERHTKLLQNWVSQGGVLWSNNNVLKLFGVRYAWLERDTNAWDCTVSQAVEVSPIVADCRKVTMIGAGGKARILAAKGVLPLLMLEGDESAPPKPGITCWSLVRYGKGWISDPKPVDARQHDGAQFWRNFRRFCLGKTPLDEK